MYAAYHTHFLKSVPLFPTLYQDRMTLLSLNRESWPPIGRFTFDYKCMYTLQDKGYYQHNRGGGGGGGGVTNPPFLFYGPVHILERTMRPHLKGFAPFNTVPSH